MSWTPCPEPKTATSCPKNIEMVIIPRTADIGNFEVHRALPFRDKRMVGPFIFWDQMGPGEFLTGQGVDVRPHPHIGLSTITYLFQGSLDHKDSLGNAVRIVPGDVNLMTAGIGIAHSERTGQDIRQKPSTLFGIQSWVAQPKNHEDGQPNFTHIDKSTLPQFDAEGIKGRVILGNFMGLKSPAPLEWDTLYVDLSLAAGAQVQIPNTTEERAIYILQGQLEIESVPYEPQQMLVLQQGAKVTIKALESSRIMILGGATMDGPRLIWWNFVASNPEKMEQAKADWQNNKFPLVPGDETDFIPLPK